MRIFILLILLLFSLEQLTSCATVTSKQPLPKAQTDIPTWGNRVEVLSNIEDWDLNALIAIRANATRDAGSANMSWKQSKQDYSILLMGPLGSNAVKLTGKPGRVSLETADGKIYHAATPEALLFQQSGWNLPVSNLYYWIRGLPVPNMLAQKSFDAENHLSELTQEGWIIKYLHYKTIGRVGMPDKMVLANAKVNVKIVIKSWEF
jgi:outer membrane lipoprotein LolB